MSLLWGVPMKVTFFDLFNAAVAERSEQPVWPDAVKDWSTLNPGHARALNMIASRLGAFHWDPSIFELMQKVVDAVNSMDSPT